MRSALDKLVSWTGILVALTLLVAGGLLLWANQFIGDQVDQQLSDQKITMPDAEALDADEALSDEDKEVMEEYAGSQLDTGAEAKAYADHYILAHLNASTGGETYSTLGGPQMAACAEDPEGQECQDLSAQRDTAFKGSTLRGLLLYGYAFATMGTIAGYAAIASFVIGLALLALALLGFRHAKQVAEHEGTTGTAGDTRVTAGV